MLKICGLKEKKNGWRLCKREFNEWTKRQDNDMFVKMRDERRLRSRSAFVCFLVVLFDINLWNINNK